MELKPCPFCGSTDVKARYRDDEGAVRICCNECDTHGPWEWKEEQAIKAWNTRANEAKES